MAVSPNAVHLTILGVQSWWIFKISFPLRGGCCFVRRFTTRGLERPLGLVSMPLAASLINANHHSWKCSGGNGTAGGKFAAEERQAVFEAEHIRRSLSRECRLQHHFAHHMMG